MSVRNVLTAVVATAGLALGATANATNLSFTGTFSKDDDVQLFNFTVSTASLVKLISFSYAGGVNAAGSTIPEGGFDPILTLFDAGGAFIARNDDGGDGDPAGSCPVPTSAVTNAQFDTCFESSLNPGNYIVAIQQFDNFHVGNLSDGFMSPSGSGPTFTSRFGCTNGQFCDVAGITGTDINGNPIGMSFNRTNAWAFDILNVDTATVVPLPATVWFLATGIAGLVVRSRRLV